MTDWNQPGLSGRPYPLTFEVWPSTAQAGQTAEGGRWHALLIRPSMSPPSHDGYVFPEVLYPACGSLAAGRYYFSEVDSLIVSLHCDQTVVDCKKCLKLAGKALQAAVTSLAAL